MNGVTIIDKVVAVPIWLLVILGLLCLLCWILTYWLLIDEYASGYLMLFISGLFLVSVILLSWCDNYDGYKVITSEDTRMEKFYADWEIKDTQGKIYYVIPQSKDSIEMTKEWDRNNG